MLTATIGMEQRGMNPIIWQPNAAGIAASNLMRFVQTLPQTFDPTTDAGYAELHRWSVAHRGEFWRRVWDFAGVIGEPGLTPVREGEHLLAARWFPDGVLNFAENLLRSGEGPALIAVNERGDRRELSRTELRGQALAFAQWLRAEGVQAGDRVAAVLPNIPEAVSAMLGTAAVGAIWSSCSPDFGADAICDRFGQIEPKILLTSRTAVYMGKTLPVEEKVRGLLPRLPSVKQLVICGSSEPNAFEQITRQTVSHFQFERFPFNHPLAILYSSGTTGAPKCIIHGSGGTLLQHLKEHQLHGDLRPGDRLFYFTTTGWMMWNWLISGLASEATIVLYDGSPLYPASNVLWTLAECERLTHFGASAKYYAAIEKAGIQPRDQHDLAALRMVLSTGSPLLPESFDFIYRAIKADLCLASISGGTDIISCFALGCPVRPVRRGELQVKGLGMDVKVFDDDGQPLVGTPGELVCTAPFPSMPVGFWNDPDLRKYRASYFERFENVWCHGDWAEETAHGGLVIYGRSDTTLNPGGVRIGTAEIYAQVEAFGEVAEALATALRHAGDEQIVLFLKMKPGQELTPDLVQAVKQRLRTHCSPRHVPTHVLAAPDFPRTISGKLSEIAVRNALHGLPIKNQAALANPESLSFFEALRHRLEQP